jgi:hypothetical protein
MEWNLRELDVNNINEIMECLETIIGRFELNKDIPARVDDANRLIKLLDGNYEVSIESTTDSVCFYITSLAVKKMFKIANLDSSGGGDEVEG